MGISDLFLGKEEKAIKFINDNEELIIEYIEEYNSNPANLIGKPIDVRDLDIYVKADLLRKYLYLIETKDKDAKSFFTYDFKDQVFHSTRTLYNTFAAIENGNKKTTYKKRYDAEAQAKSAEETLNKIMPYTQKVPINESLFNGYSRKR